MEKKTIVSTLYLKDGAAVNGFRDFTSAGNLYSKVRLYNDSGIDKIIIYDLSEDDKEHEKNIQTIKKLAQNIEIPICAGGNINRLEDIKKILYAGCKQVVLNASKPETAQLADEGSKRFGKEKMLLSIENVDYIFKHSAEMTEMFHELVVVDPAIVEAVESMTPIPYIVQTDSYEADEIIETLRKVNVRGIMGDFIGHPEIDVMELKADCRAAGIKMDNFEPSVQWSDLKLNSDGMVPVIVQDYKTNDVLMLAYMNEEAFNTTINIGKMTYYSRSRQELWIKGMTSGHIQYVKSLTADCDYDTLLARVSQIGAACHTGNRTCFFNEIIKKEYVEKNPLKVFETVYNVIADRKEHPREGSYTNYLFDKGIDKILKKCGEECTEIVIAAKNPDPEEIKYEISDFLYHVMVLMVERGVTWEEITAELSQR
ncbi:MAG: bifunctional phosphoribosyl-AMP cyclohydrolase/phosphoribosyl-ATP diphosphatase HisIE [Lachnospiraceae bacterium]|nr:bifunctional phosphoribosyl-AMP cyclohydrolase/phosphoribosyl-ATP diphosphatase HisIE [Lachnospiraceae bacterium]